MVTKHFDQDPDAASTCLHADVEGLLSKYTRET
jgi:hypothetical protein